MKKYYTPLLITILTIVTMLTTTNCELTKLKEPEPGSHVIIRGELLMTLRSDIINEKLDEFISDYSEYRLTLAEILIPSIPIYVFYYDYRLIYDYVFIEILRADERVTRVNFNR